MDKFAIFIDGGYIKKLTKLEYKVKIDYGKFATEIYGIVKARTAAPLDFLRTFYYDCPPYQSNPPTPTESMLYSNYRRFSNSLNRLPNFEVREGRLELKGFDKNDRPIFQQKRTDLMMGLDIASYSAKGQVSHIALVSGDSDLIPAIEMAKKEGINTWLFHGPKYPRNGNCSHHDDLWKECDNRYQMDYEFFKNCELIYA